MPKEYEEIFNNKFKRRLEADIKKIIFGQPKQDEETSSEAGLDILKESKKINFVIYVYFAVDHDSVHSSFIKGHISRHHPSRTLS